MKYTYRTFAAILFLGVAAFAQQPPPPAGAGPGAPAAPGAPPAPPAASPLPRPGGHGRNGGGPPPMREGPGMEALRGPQGRWWGNPDLVQKLGITNDQVKRMDDILQQHRLRLVDLHANLDKQELLLDPLVNADQPDEARILAQIDKVAQARADLEKANARMLLDIRRVLTADQWQKLKTERPAAPRPGRGGPPAPGRGE